MSKTIWLHDNTYHDLDEVRDKRESFDHVVARLLDIRRMVIGIEPALSGEKAYHEFRAKEAIAKEATNR